MGNICCGKKHSKQRPSNSPLRDPIPEGILFSVGSPLLDILVTVPPEFLHKYQLKENEAQLLRNDELGYYNDIIHDLIQNHRSGISYIAGGSAQNTMRVAQWIIDSPNACVFVGSIGKDYFGKTLFQKALDDGIVGQYQLVSGMPTGTCVVLITGKGKRTLLACLAAAESLNQEFLLQKENEPWMEKAQFFYITAYSLISMFGVLMHVAQYALTNNRHLIMHLSAPYIYSKCLTEVNSILPYVDVVIGSADEVKAFASCQDFKTDNLEEIALMACSLPISNSSFTRIVVVTQGTAPVIIAQDKTIKKYKVPPIRHGAIKDFNGAGDAFVGGFLAQFVQNASIEICVQCGIWAAAEIIKQEGCQFPKNKYFNPFLLTAVK
ncbi:unnamed protein product [Allacma fusca]|uniref:Adenosine kinase n=1 Tax=Allacma fusca TaxID=39272 RepID=A0A8J2Q5U1_9HEXA|nr:unnamed protein product [Allacma fusca]